MTVSKKSLVVKQGNALVNASYKLTVAEKRLLILCIAQANGNQESLKDCSVHASEYAKQYGVTASAAYKALQESALQLFDRQFTYQEKGKKGSVTKLRRWVQGIDYGQADGILRVIFSDDVLPVLINLKEAFTYYGIEQVSSLTSTHAIRLYELLIAWRSTGKTPAFDVAEFRSKLGIEQNEYPRMDNFKRRVLDAAIKQINAQTDITAKYEQHKRGRSITGFSFTFKQKNAAKSLSTVKKGRQRITKKEAEEMAYLGEEWPDLLARLTSQYHIIDM